LQPALNLAQERFRNAIWVMSLYLKFCFHVLQKDLEFINHTVCVTRY